MPPIPFLSSSPATLKIKTEGKLKWKKANLTAYPAFTQQFASSDHEGPRAVAPCIPRSVPIPLEVDATLGRRCIGVNFITRNFRKS